MKLILQKDVVAGIPEAWARQYRDYKDTGSRLDKGPITRALKALPPGFTREQVDAIIGNGSWTRLKCEECGEETNRLIILGGNLHDQYSICGACVSAAHKLLSQENEG